LCERFERSSGWPAKTVILVEMGKLGIRFKRQCNKEYLMRSLQFAIFAFGLFFLTSCAEWGGAASALVGKPAPPIDLERLGGGRFRSADYVGKEVVMVDIWATSCGPCRKELPILAAVAREYRSRGLVFCAVSLGDERQKVAEFIRGERLNVAVGLDEKGAVAGAYHAHAIPMLILIDKAGIVRFVHIGLRPDLKATLHAEIDGLLSAKAVAVEIAGEKARS
jgi:thiol-disulfide isomerase/thioredoxin